MTDDPAPRRKPLIQEMDEAGPSPADVPPVPDALPEGAAAAPVAALLQGLVKVPPGSRVACVLSGGNVNLEQLKGLRWN